jgi:hypothetical protein
VQGRSGLPREKSSGQDYEKLKAPGLNILDKPIVLSIAGINIRFNLKGSFPTFKHSPEYEKFFIKDPADVHTVIDVNYINSDSLKPQAGKEIFDSGGLWKLFTGTDGAYTLEIRTPPENPHPQKALYLNKDFSYGEMFCTEAHENRPFPPIVEYP